MGDYSSPGDIALRMVAPASAGFTVTDVTDRLGWPYPPSSGSQHSGLGVTRRGDRLTLVATPNASDPDLFTAVSRDGGETWRSWQSSFERCGEFAGPAQLPDGRLLVFGFPACDPVERHAWISDGTADWRRTGPDVGVHSGNSLCSTDSAAYFARSDYVATDGNHYSLQRSTDGVTWRTVPLPEAWPLDAQMTLACDGKTLAISAASSPNVPGGQPAAFLDPSTDRLVPVRLPRGTAQLEAHDDVLIASGSRIAVSDDRGASWRTLADFKDQDPLVGASAVGSDGTVYVKAHGLLWATSESRPRSPEDVAREFTQRRVQGASLDDLWDVVAPWLLHDEMADGLIVNELTEGGRIKEVSCQDYQRTNQLCRVDAAGGVALVLLERSPNRTDWVVAGAKGMWAPKDVPQNYYPPA